MIFFTLYLGAVENVSIQLKWRNSFQFAGIYMAKEKGFYKKEGLSVDIKELAKGFKTNTVEEVESGKVTYGISDSKLIYEVLNGRKLELLIPIMKHSPLLMIALNQDVKNLQDIRDKRVVISKNTVISPPVVSMFKSKGIDASKLNIKNLKYDYKNFLKHKAVFSLYETDELYYLDKLHAKYKLFNPRDYGFDFYGDILFTSKKELELHPKRVKKFIKATIKGWRYALSHVDETIKIILQKYNTQKLKYGKLKDEARRLVPYMSKKFSFDENRIQNISDVYVLLGIVYAKQDIKDHIYNPMVITKKEKLLLKNHLFKCMTVSNWEPFTLMQDGKLVGIAIDFLNEVKKRTNLKTDCSINDNWNDILEQIKNKKVDFTISTDITDDRKRYAIFSKPYATYPIVIVTRQNVNFVSDMNFLQDKTLAVAKNYTAYKLLKKHYPNLRIIETKNTYEALELVKKGKAFAAIDILPVMSYMINKRYSSTLKISGKTPFIFKVRFMARKDYPELISILNRAINGISQSKRREIYNRYVSLIYQDGYSMKEMAFILFVSLLLVSIVLFWVLKLKREIGRRKELEQELEKLATIDRLTSIYNRYKIDLTLKELIEISSRYERVFSVIFLDIDHFKNINDTFGHTTGDKVLIELAKTVKTVLRKSDIFGRWGGEEFLIILPETEKNRAIELAEKLRKLIESHRFEEVERLTCSFGVVQYKRGDTSDSMLKRVDERLYGAKHRGRNRVVY